MGCVGSQTERQQKKRPSRNGEQHADDIELHKVVLESLGRGTCVGPRRIDASLLALPNAPQENQSRWDTESDKDDDESAESPAPSRVVVEVLCDLRAGKDCCDGRRCEDSVHDDTVAESRRIGQDDRNNVQETDVTDLRWLVRTRFNKTSTILPTYPVDGVCGCISLDVVTRCFHDRSHNDKQQHAEETFDATPDVKDLRDKEVANTARDRSNDADDGSQSVLAERRGDVWVEVGLDSREQ